MSTVHSAMTHHLSVYVKGTESISISTGACCARWTLKSDVLGLNLRSLRTARSSDSASYEGPSDLQGPESDCFGGSMGLAITPERGVHSNESIHID